MMACASSAPRPWPAACRMRRRSASTGWLSRTSSMPASSTWSVSALPRNSALCTTRRAAPPPRSSISAESRNRDRDALGPAHHAPVVFRLILAATLRADHTAANDTMHSRRRIASAPSRRRRTSDAGRGGNAPPALGHSGHWTASTTADKSAAGRAKTCAHVTAQHHWPPLDGPLGIRSWVSSFGLLKPFLQALGVDRRGLCARRDAVCASNTIRPTIP